MNSQLSAKNSANWSSRLFSIIERDVSARISRVFSGLGEFLRDSTTLIQVRPAVEPKIQPASKFSFAVLDQLRETLEKLESQGVIASVDSPTDWVNNLVVTKKTNGGIRICLDPKSLNQAIKTECFSNLLQPKSRPSLVEVRCSVLDWISEMPTGKSGLQSHLLIFAH